MQLRFRSGRVVAAPAGFLERLPLSLDNPAFVAGARPLRRTLRCGVHRADDALWRELRYMLFELPGAPGRSPSVPARWCASPKGTLAATAGQKFSSARDRQPAWYMTLFCRHGARAAKG